MQPNSINEAVLRMACPYIPDSMQGMGSQFLTATSLFYEKTLKDHHIGVLSGPNNAMEVAEGKPAAIVLATDKIPLPFQSKRLSATRNFGCIPQMM